MRRQAGTGLGALQWRGHGATVGLPACGQKGMQQRLGGVAPARLRLGEAAILQPESRGGGQGIGGQRKRVEPVRRGQRLAAHERVTPRRPAIPRVEPAHHARLRKFRPGDPHAARPCGHGLVTGEGPAIAGFLMADQAGGGGLPRNLFKTTHRVAHPQDQCPVALGKRVAQIVKALAQEPILPP